MACAGSLDHGKVIWSHPDNPDQPAQPDRYIYKASGRGTVYRFHLRPIPCAISVWLGTVRVHGQRYAGEV